MSTRFLPAALLPLTVGCNLLPAENESAVSGAWQASPHHQGSPTAAFAPDSAPDSASYLMWLDLAEDTDRVIGMLESTNDTTGSHPTLLEGYLRQGSPDVLLLEYGAGCSMYGEAPGDDIERRYHAERHCGEVRDSLLFKPANTGWIEGRVTEDGEAADAEAVYVYEPGTDWLDGRRIETDETGRFRFTNLDPGTWIVKVLLSCYPNDREQAVRVVKGQVTKVTFTC